MERNDIYRTVNRGVPLWKVRWQEIEMGENMKRAIFHFLLCISVQFESLKISINFL